MRLYSIRNLLHFLRYTPFHPQWFAFLAEKRRHRRVGNLAFGKVLDIGCGRKPLLKYLRSDTTYFSLDYLDKDQNYYNSNPDTFGDAKALPFAQETFNTVILLEVLEHIDDPHKALTEACRVLSQDGLLVISTPFLYPVHDAPNDYQRWTSHGLEKILEKCPVSREENLSFGQPLETAILLLNLSLSWLTLKGTTILRLPLLLLTFLTVPILNLLAYILSKLNTTKCANPFPTGYFIISRKK